MSLTSFHEKARALSAAFAADNAERTTRVALDPVDFENLISAGYLRCGVPESHGGWFRSLAHSVRPVCDSLREIARGDGCVALVAAMHPAVLVYWCLDDPAPDEYADAWRAQREDIFAGVLAGELWGTITSEPGSGGDVMKTRTAAEQATYGDQGASARPHSYWLSGNKHFASGSGMSNKMITTALPVGEDVPDIFYVNIKDSPWDGSNGVTMTGEWRAHGMMATQSHAFRFEGYPAQRIAWHGRGPQVNAQVGGFANALFVSVILGVLDIAMQTARQRITKRHTTLRALEQVAWQRAENDYWTACQAYQGMLRAVETQPAFVLDTVRAKTVVGELAERALEGVGRAMGGGAFTRYNPLGQWSQDVKALGFLRPPWGLAFEQLVAMQTQSATAP